MSLMEGEKILMSQGQLQRWHVMGLVEVGKVTLKEAGEKNGEVSGAGGSGVGSGTAESSPSKKPSYKRSFSLSVDLSDFST